MSPFTEELAYYNKYLKEHPKDNIISKEEVIKRLEKENEKIMKELTK